MNDMESLKHTVWDCKYHLVWIPKYRKKVLYGNLRKYLGEMLKDLAAQRECKVHEGHLVGDHVHKLISIPPMKTMGVWPTLLTLKNLRYFIPLKTMGV